jgi:hypothetical protein
MKALRRTSILSAMGFGPVHRYLSYTEVDMKWSSEGMRRLAILCGAVASFGWLVFVFVVSNGFHGFAKEPLIGLIVVVVGMLFWFATVFSLIWGIDWVRLGFKK